MKLAAAGVDLSVHRIAISDAYRCAPDDVRFRWSWWSFIEAHHMLDLIDAERPKDPKHG